MDFVSGIVVFIMIWWITLFITLPWGNKPPEDDEAVDGQVMSAPAVPHLKRKFIATTIISLVLWFGISYLIEIKVIDFHSMARTMHNESMVK